jgi:3-ketosteroid 9alpha-monooxygenase subunit B
MLFPVQFPPVDDRLAVTVKRTADGYASNWLCDNVKIGAQIECLPPSGVFTPADLDADLLLIAGTFQGAPSMMRFDGSRLHHRRRRGPRFCTCCGATRYRPISTSPSRRKAF